MDVKLVMFRNDGKRKEFPIVSRTVVIGRAEGCDLRVPLLSVSRRHCEVTVEGDEVMVRDLGSSNGTYVNNKKVAEKELQAGDRLVVGPVVFTVQINGKPEEIQPVKTKGQKLSESSLVGDTAVAGKAKEDTHASPASEEELADLENLIAETLREENEDTGEETLEKDEKDDQ
jgi:pSer/pThr/pTyr-binding forkhead associated (FHA) protein